MKATITLREDQLVKFRAMSALDNEVKLARAMGAHQGTVNRVLNGRQKPSGDFIASLVRAFKGATFDDLWVISTESEAA